jgi:hypothetical protein
MTTELAVQESNIPAITQGSQSSAIGQLMQHVQAMSSAYDLAEKLCNTTMVPAIYRGKPDDATAAILYGSELGLTPIQSLQQIFVVQGKPAIYARTMVALLMSKGHEVWTETTGDEAVTVCGRMRGSDHVERSKAASEVCRKIAPDVLLGIGYSREELELEQPPVRVRSERVSGGVSGLKAALGLGDPAPSEDVVDDESVAMGQAAAEAASNEGSEPEAPQVELITAAELKRLWAKLTDVGLTKQDECLAWINDTLNLDEAAQITNTRAITAEQAKALFKELDKADQ